MAKDILMDEDFEFVIQGGDLAIGDADDQNLQHLALTNKGELKFDPTLGLDLVKFNKKRLPSVGDLGMINQSLTEDGWVNQRVVRENLEYEIRADRAE